MGPGLVCWDDENGERVWMGPEIENIESVERKKSCKFVSNSESHDYGSYQLVTTNRSDSLFYYHHTDSTYSTSKQLRNNNDKGSRVETPDVSRDAGEFFFLFSTDYYLQIDLHRF
jgi:hypothetical protein